MPNRRETSVQPQYGQLKENMKTFLRRLPLSRFLAKTLRVNRIAMQNLLNNMSFEVDFKLYVAALMYKMNINNISGLRN